jgi:sugar phosphate isomerase/epimerase
MTLDARVGFVAQLPMDPVETVEFAAAEGFDYVELFLDGPHAPDRVDGEAVAEASARTGVDLAAHLAFGGVDLGTPLGHVREGSCRELEAAVEAAAGFGVERAVAHLSTNAWSPAWDDDEVRAALFDSVRRLAAFGRDHGCELCFENVPRGAFTTHDLPALFEATDASATLDTGHARIDGRDAGGTAALVADYPHRIRHVHLNDTRGPSDDHLPFGAGDLDFETILRALPSDWGGTLSLEVFTFSFDYVAASKRRLDALLARL